jgi:hypothetical protein
MVRKTDGKIFFGPSFQHNNGFFYLYFISATQQLHSPDGEKRGCVDAVSLGGAASDAVVPGGCCAARNHHIDLRRYYEKAK